MCHYGWSSDDGKSINTKKRENPVSISSKFQINDSIIFQYSFRVEGDVFEIDVTDPTLFGKKFVDLAHTSRAHKHILDDSSAAATAKVGHKNVEHLW